MRINKIIAVLLLISIVCTFVIGCRDKNGGNEPNKGKVVDDNNTIENGDNSSNNEYKHDNNWGDRNRCSNNNDKDNNITLHINVTEEDGEIEKENRDEVENGIGEDVENIILKNKLTYGLFRDSYVSSKNILVSPLSVNMALSMVTNGADGNTLEELKSVLGCKDVKVMNKKMKEYIGTVDDSKELHIANSVWIKDDNKLKIKEEFINNLRDSYKSGINRLKFDYSAVNKINNWVNENTKEMIPEIIEEIKKEDIMFLINAIAFDAKWEEKYDKDLTRKEDFRNIGGDKSKVDMMYSTENRYIEEDNVTGFIKSYDGGRYEFIALLPHKGVNIDDTINSLSDEKINDYINNAKTLEVETKMPRFKFEFGIELNEVLKNMGIKDAFDGIKANFIKLGEYEGENIYIGKVLHKTFVEVDEEGTKAAAVTSIGMVRTTSVNLNEPKKVYLDRPFIFIIIDKNIDIPMFIGSVVKL